MATLGHDFLDLIEIYKGQQDNGVVASIINMLSQTNGVLDDAITMPANMGTVHKSTFISGIPVPDWGKLYKGTGNKRITRTQIQDTTGFIEALSSVDDRLTKYVSNLGAYRLQEAQGIIEGMAQEAARAIFYEDQASHPDRITGFAPRFNNLASPQGNQIIDAGGVGADNMSIWFIQWGMDGAHMIYPKDSTAGITREDKGRNKTNDADNNPYFSLDERFQWDLGLVVRDHRKVVRIANIDASNLDDGNVDLMKFMRKAFYQWHGARRADQGTQGIGDVGDGNFKMGRGAIYCNKDAFEALDAIATNAGVNDNFVRLKPMEIQGQEVITYRGHPIRQVDQLINTEARVI